MAKEVIMPKFGFTQEESEIIEWLKKEGEPVEKGDPIATVSTDKLSMEVEAPEDGILSGIRYEVGDVVPVTQIIAYILQPGEALPKEAVKISAKIVGTEYPEETQDIGVNATPLALRMMQDAAIQASDIKGSGTDGKITKTDVEEYLALRSAGKTGGKVAATPAAKRAAGELNVDLTSISGSGPKGRIQEADVKQISASAAKPIIPHIPADATRVPLTGMRRIIAENMARSMREAPHMNLQMDVDMSAAVVLREQAVSTARKKDTKFTYTALITKAAAWSLKLHPKMNSLFNGNEIVILPAIHVGVAVSVEEGLIVPVIRNADQKNTYQISDEIKDLAERARANKLLPDELEGGTFTISNLGMYEVDRFTAIINPPQAGILAVGNIVERFVPDDEKRPVLKPIMTITVSADHRIVDGAEAAEFLQDVKKGLENPGLMVI